MGIMDKTYSEKPGRQPRQGSSFLGNVLWVGLGIALVVGSALIGFALLLASQLPVVTQSGGLITWLLSLDHSQVTWYITRSAGITAYLLLWFSTAWGLAVPSRILDGILHGSFTFEFHQFISLLAIAFTLLHIGVLVFDQYMAFSIVQLFFPFISDYRPTPVGVGILSFYIVLLVTITFYLRSRIGMKAFRAIHVLSLVSFFGVAAHGLFAGTDSPLPSVQGLYLVTSLSVVFLTTYWLASKVFTKRPQANRLRAQDRS